MSTYREIQEQIGKLQEQAAGLLKAERNQAIANIVEQMNVFNISPEELTTRRKQPAQKSAASNAKFRDPATGKIWSGRGRQPNWVKGHEQDFLVR